ncbi:ZIP metal ion transporter family [Actinidia rufa]|uniref:ZIP metal ion transporter family n=1 Tax=Actinidia rufa TaxID=165716 RepID=A0A7J0EBN2_9ERIC|nr:ZIP metal ion transporter family [Actinidia rufa]
MGRIVLLHFGLGSLLGRIGLVAFALAFDLQHALRTGMASGIAFVLAAWRPLQLLVSPKMGFSPFVFLLVLGCAFPHISTTSTLKLTELKRTSAGTLSVVTGISVSAIALQSFLSSVSVAFHAVAEGLALGVAAPKAYVLGQYMVLPGSFICYWNNHRRN